MNNIFNEEQSIAAINGRVAVLKSAVVFLPKSVISAGSAIEIYLILVVKLFGVSRYLFPLKPRGV
jgi:hypothetical protein